MRTTAHPAQRWAVWSGVPLGPAHSLLPLYDLFVSDSSLRDVSVMTLPSNSWTS